MEHQPHDPAVAALAFEELPLQVRRIRRGEELTEQELEGLVDLLSATARQDVLRSLSEGKPIDDLGARLIAIFAAAFIDEETPLEGFIETGTGSPDALRAAYRALYDDTSFSPEVQVLLDFLGTNIAGRNRSDTPPDGPVMASVRVAFPSTPAHDGRWHPIALATHAPTSKEDETRLLNQAIDAVSIHGDPFRAWLRVPGVDAADPDLIDAFTRRYHGVVATAADAERLIDHHIIDVCGTLYAFRPDPAQHTSEGAR